MGSQDQASGEADRDVGEGAEVCIILYLGTEPRAAELPFPAGRWVKRLDAADSCWLGAGSALPAVTNGPVLVTLGPWSAAVYAGSPDDL